MDSAPLTSPQWFEAMAEVTKAIASPHFVTALLDALAMLGPVKATTVYLYPRHGVPSAWFECDADGPWLPEGNVRRYLSGFYLLDPFYGACIETARSGCFTLSDVAPDHFTRSEYYQAFYQHSHLEDEINYVLQFEHGLSLAVSLAFTDVLDEAVKARFTLIAPWALAVLGKHFDGYQGRGGRVEQVWEQRVHAALSNFGSSLLTERECRIAQLILRGHSTKSLAERLNVSEDTIKSHRKHVYAKLDIGTQSELFALFIDALANAQGVLGKDPLESYMGKPR
ncbi:helix-turn-helix transcriptional regulator [Pseudomonas entomophila]|uniref:helix-turn-helix domain-containing protein n=1 Tax=Pseudomonas entomophila TaxID=312306 RepID=UPI0015E2C647|nr:helix-turn-helix transcriptional regulator [Pseudomonas entomophila]MBA1188199.1 helix-turn-helix transcriptional regulator [Pseudomonas entomophila]